MPIARSARDGRESPLKYTARCAFAFRLIARDGRESPLKYTGWNLASRLHQARDGRESPLKYTQRLLQAVPLLARDGRESPLKYTMATRSPTCWRLGMAGNHRSSTLGRMEAIDYN